MVQNEKCFKCGSSVDGDGYQLDNGQFYHPKCLTCTVCNNTLDGAFYNRDDKYYCINDYKAKFGKSCAKCSQFIDSNGILVSGQDFHANCFTCTHCKKVIEPGAVIIYKRGEPHCNTCGELVCSGCDNVISTDYLSAFNKKWHQECFSCAECKAPLGTGKFVEFNGKAFCEKDIDKVKSAHHDPATDCACCRRAIGLNEAIKAMDKHFHTSCFRCDTCQAELSGSFYEKNGKNYCEKDYRNQFNVTCAKCNSEISGNYLKVNDSHYHAGCVNCSTCQAPFGDGDQIYMKEDKYFCVAHK